ncbi:MAG: glycosyltransferase [Chitinophagaceae bacterium]|nr:MAG: glycosyltransferase [Chitinophagaceae bacterium]
MNTLLLILRILLICVEVVVAFYMLIPLFSVLTYGFFKLFGIKPFTWKKIVDPRNFEFAMIITAHQDIRFIFPLVDSILKQEYQHFYIYVVADDCDVSTLVFNDPRVIILRPEVGLHAKTRSIRYAIDHFVKKHDAVVIFDVDNLIHPKFLTVINNHFQRGYKVVQADFKPKNTESSFARMDAMGDMLNFFIDRESKMLLGLSSAIWGAGIAVDLDLYNSVEYKDNLGGFDKKLQSHTVLNVKRIAFAPEAILYDEKIDSGASLEKQRTRWLSSYFKYLGENSMIFREGLKKFDFNLIYFGAFTVRPPLFILMAVALVITVINFFISIPAFIFWICAIASFFISFIAIVLIKGKNIAYLKTMFMLPAFIFRQVMALLKLGKAKKSFMKTEHHQVVYIDDILK